MFLDSMKKYLKAYNGKWIPPKILSMLSGHEETILNQKLYS